LSTAKVRKLLRFCAAKANLSFYNLIQTGADNPISTRFFVAVGSTETLGNQAKKAISDAANNELKYKA